MFAKTFGCARFIYNKMLGDRLDYYKETGKKLNNTPAQYKSEFPWLKEVDSLALANVQLNLNKAYNNFWNNRKHFFIRQASSVGKSERAVLWSILLCRTSYLQ